MVDDLARRSAHTLVVQQVMVGRDVDLHEVALAIGRSYEDTAAMVGGRAGFSAEELSALPEVLDVDAGWLNDVFDAVAEVDGDTTFPLPPGPGGSPAIPGFIVGFPNQLGFPTIGRVWRRIEAHEGQVFRQMRGGEFTYAVTSSYLEPDRTNQKLPRAHFEEALALVPLENTTPVQHLRGPSYLYAILMDQRIRLLDW
jgi:hypothetical protein